MFIILVSDNEPLKYSLMSLNFGMYCEIQNNRV